MSQVILVTGAGGCLAGHLVKRLLDDGEEVRAVDIKPLDQWWQLDDRADNIANTDLRSIQSCRYVTSGVDWLYNAAADMGGIGYITEKRADPMYSVLINTHLLQAAVASGVQRYFYTSSACVYPAGLQSEPEYGYALLSEEDAYPAQPEPGYGEEKLFSERMCEYVSRDYGIEVRVARLHNVYGPYGTWQGGREKAPAAICRKVAKAIKDNTGEIEIWGDGTATRSFLFVDDFVEGALKIMNSDYSQPINLGSDQVVTVDELVDAVEAVAGTHLKRKYNRDAPVGVAGRGSDNTLIQKVTGWTPRVKLSEGLEPTYKWIAQQIR